MARNAKHTATISLGVMGAGFLAAFPIADTPFGLVLQTGFEAGLAGGLADWFAVTALFRHPMGLPIPHTALLPRNREKVTNALVNAIQTNLLHKESILEKLKGTGIAEKLVEAVRDSLQQDEVRAWLSSAAKNAVSGFNPQAAAKAVAPVVSGIVRDLDAAHWIGKAAREAVDRGYDETAFDYALTQAEKFVVREDTRMKMGAMAARALESVQVGGLMGFAMNAFAGFMSPERIGSIIQDFLLGTIADMRHPNNSYRQSALMGIRDTLIGLKDNERVLQEVSGWKRHAAESAQLEETIAQWIGKMQEWAGAKVSDPEFMEGRLIPFLRSSLDRALQRPDMLQSLDELLHQQIALLVERNHGAIGALVKENADKLDNETLIEMMEDHVGKDLQWIRVNGAICGFAIGLVLGVVHLLV
jgi:uncharacterized membrane-anchored protein YjiN (DUF445 family)